MKIVFQKNLKQRILFVICVQLFFTGTVHSMELITKKTEECQVNKIIAELPLLSFIRSQEKLKKSSPEVWSAINKKNLVSRSALDT